MNRHLSSKSLTQDPNGFNEGYAAFAHIVGTCEKKKGLVDMEKTTVKFPQVRDR